MAPAGRTGAAASCRPVGTGRDPVIFESRNFCIISDVRILSTTDVLARFGKALADPTRAAILLKLTTGPAFPSDLADGIGVSRQILSNHLACLRDCGLVAANPAGRRVRYDLSDPRLAHALEDLLGTILTVDPLCSCTEPDCPQEKPATPALPALTMEVHP